MGEGVSISVCAQKSIKGSSTSSKIIKQVAFDSSSLFFFYLRHIKILHGLLLFHPFSLLAICTTLLILLLFFKKLAKPVQEVKKKTQLSDDGGKRGGTGKHDYMCRKE